MLNLLKIIRYLVFAVFVICNAVITSVAVWNLGIIQPLPMDSAKHIDSFLIFVGASGLLLIFTILFFELYGKNVFLGRVWFELAWICIFCAMQFIGAGVITAQSSSQTCDPNSGAFPFTSSQESPCASTQVLQAFTWICATLLLGYLTLLSILTIVKRRDDPTILHCSVRRFPIMSNQNLKSEPASPAFARSMSRPRFRGEAPIIAAPIPRRIATTREAILSYRSGLSLEYEIEHYQSPESVFHAPTEERAVSPVSQPFAASFPPPPQNNRPVEQEQQAQQTLSSSPFYHTSVQTALDERPNQPQAPPPAHLGQVRRLPPSPSPPPLGDWPRLDAAKRPPRIKRKPLPQPFSEPSQPQLLDHPQPQSQQPPPPLQIRQPRPLPPSQPTASSSYAFDAPALTAALQPLQASQSMRSKPSGPRRKSNSIDDGRPTDLDLSNARTFRSRGFS